MDEAVIGVGPWVGEWPTDEHYDPELLEHGDRRNVVDRYRYWRREAVVADLDKRRHGFHVAIENWQHDLNIGTVVIRHHPTIEEFGVWAAGERLPVIGIDNLPGSRPVETVTLPRRCVLLFGQEGPGLSGAARAACTELFSIAQYGSTRSINAGVASGIAMHAWIRAYAGPPPE